MADFFRQVDALQVQSEQTMRMAIGGMDNRNTSSRTIAAVRPNRLSIRSGKDDSAIDFVSDGETLVTYVPTMNQYMESDAPADIEELLANPLVMGGPGGGMPPFVLLLLSEDPYGSMMEGVTETEYVGIELLDGVPAHHVRCLQEQLDWDAWVAAEGDPLLLKVESDLSRSMAQFADQFGGGELQMTMTETFRDWKVNQPPPSESFVFTPPEGAEEVDDFFGGSGEPELSPLVGQPAPPVELPLLDGSPLSLERHRGEHIVMLDFWATWCGPCVAEMPLLVEVADEYRDKGVVFYALNQGEEPDEIRAFQQEQELTFQVGLDTDSAVGDAYGVQGIPMLVLIDREGVVQVVHIGYRPDIKEKLSQELDDLLSGKNLAEEALAAERERNAPVEPLGFEEAWSSDGAFAAVAVNNAGLLYATTSRGKCAVLDGAGSEVRTFELGAPVEVLRTAELSAGSGTELLGFSGWGDSVLAVSDEGTELWKESGGMGINDVAAADLDGDGLDEVIVGYNGGTGLHVFSHDGQRRWETTSIGNVWNVSAGDVNGDGKVEVVTTSATGQVHLFDAAGESIGDLETPIYCNMVRVRAAGPDESGAMIVVIGSGENGEQMVSLNADGNVQWTLDLHGSVEHCDSLAIAKDLPWAVAGLRGGLVLVVDLTNGEVVSQMPGLGSTPQVAWLSEQSGAPPLVIVATGSEIKGLRVVVAETSAAPE